MCKQSCKQCSCLIKSTSVVVSSNTLQITVPSTAFENLKSYCLVICQSIPATGLGLPVTIVSGSNKINAQDRIGNNLLGAQIRSRCRYKLVYATNPIHFYSSISALKCERETLKSDV